MAEENTQAEMQQQQPYITIDDVQISVDDLPDEAKGIFGRLQRLNQKKANLVLDLEELQAGINFFSNRIVEVINYDCGDSWKTYNPDYISASSKTPMAAKHTKVFT